MTDPADHAPSVRPAEPWAPPAAAPFGPPPGQPTPAVYAPPPGYAGPYGAQAAPAVVEPAARGSRLGLVALIAAIGAAILAPLGAGVAAFRIGAGTGAQIAAEPVSFDFDWSMLSTVREWVLMAEVSFWVGTALGVWAIVQGLIAIVTGRGRGLGIAAVALAVLGPIVFILVLQFSLTAGYAAGG